MKKKPQLDDVDVLFDPKPLSEEEKLLISTYIRESKAQLKKKHFKHQKINVKHTKVGVLR